MNWLCALRGHDYAVQQGPGREWITCRRCGEVLYEHREE